jgi:ribosomal protein L11 methylase PrmA
VLLDHAEILYNKLKTGGTFICSGILRDDEEIIRNVYSAKGFLHINTIQKENWISIAFQKTN